MENYLSEEELKALGLKEYGEDVRIGRHAVLYSPEQLTLGSHVRIDDFTVVSGMVTLRDYIHISQFCGLHGEMPASCWRSFRDLPENVLSTPCRMIIQGLP